MILGPTVRSRMMAELVSLAGGELVDDELVAAALCVGKQK